MRSKSPRFLCEFLLSSAVLSASMAPGHAGTPPSSSVHQHLTAVNSTGQAVISSTGQAMGRVPVMALPNVSLLSAGEETSGVASDGGILRPSTSGIVMVSQVAQSVPLPGSSQANPNQDRFLQQPAPVPASVPPAEVQPPAPPIAQPTQPATPSGQTIAVQRIEVTGSTVLTQADITPITKPLEGRSATLEELRGVADAITQLYLDRGFITSRAILVDQTISNGVVQIRAVEGGVEKIDVEGTTRINPDYIRSRIELAGTRPLNKDRLEDQLRLLRADPNFENVEASLRAGNEFGQSILTVRVKESNPFNAVFSADNFSPPSVGSERLGVGLSYRNLISANGDQLAASYSRSTTGGSSLFDFSYRVVVNPMNGTVQLRYAPSEYKITDPDFAAFGIRGNSELFELSFRQPLILTPRQEFALSVGFARQTGRTFLFDSLATPFGIGPEANGNSRTSVFKFGQDYVTRDVQGAWAFRSQFNFGVDFLGVTTNPSPIPDGQFFSWLGQAQRVQVLNNDQILIVQADLQLTPDTLLPSQQFVIGGGQSLRGYRQNARSGDNGFRFSVENRIVVQRNEAGAAEIQVAPFLDLGTVWNTSGNPNALRNQTFLVGAGAGVIWQPFPGFGLRLDYAVPIITLDDRGNNVQDSALYFSVNYQL